MPNLEAVLDVKRTMVARVYPKEYDVVHLEMTPEEAITVVKELKRSLAKFDPSVDQIIPVYFRGKVSI